MLDLLNAIWRPLTVAVMGAFPVLVGFGLAPERAMDHVNNLLAFAGSVIVLLASLRAAQRVRAVQAEPAKAEAVAKAAELLPVELRAAAADPQLLDALADGVVRRLRDRGMPS